MRIQKMITNFQKYLIGQIIAAALAIKVAFAYVDTHDADSINDAMGSMAAAAQIFSLVGGIYEIVSFLFLQAWVTF